MEKMFNMGSRQYYVSKKHQLWYQQFFAETFSTFISRPTTQFVVFMSYLLYLFVTVNGLLRLEVGFDVSFSFNILYS